MEPLQMNEKTAPELPQSWVWTTLGEICLNPQYGWTTSAKNEGYLHLLRTTDITSGNIDWDSVPFCKKEPADKEKYLLRDNDIVISRAGSVGYSHLIKNPKGAVFASYLIRFKPLIDEQYTSYFLKSPSYWDSISEKSLGIAVPNVNATKLKQISIPLPPLPEQHRIVTKIEELFARLDAGVGALTNTKSQLKHYRQSVLKSACEGRLVPTEAELARAEGREYEPADVLLACIGKERREKWEAEKKRRGKKNAKYKEPAAPDVSGLPELPEGWCWVNVDSFTVFGPQNGLYLPKSAYGVGVSIIRIDDFQDDSSRSAHELHQVNADQNDIRKYSLMENDLVINRVNSPTHLGKCLVVVERNLPSIFESNMMRLRLSASVNPFFVGFYLRSVSGKKRLISNAKWAVNQASINQKDVVSTPAPLLPLAEQHRIVAEIERRLSVADEIEKTIDHSLKQAERLRQSILKRAFEGKLVSQDPNDEPASVLLERIKAEKAKREAEKKTKNKRKRKGNPKQKKSI